jgi:uncharacterized protein YdaU (DUF1376 family)
MNYYRRYSGDYLRDTARLTLTEHGAYTLMLDYIYSDEQPLPADKAEIYLLVRAMRTEDKRAVDKVLAMFFVLEADGYHQKRADKEIATARSARENGKGGGRPAGKKKTGTATERETGINKSGYENDDENGTGSRHPPTTNLNIPIPTLDEGSDLPGTAPPLTPADAAVMGDQALLTLGIEQLQFRDKLGFHTAQTYLSSRCKLHGTPAVIAALREMVAMPAVVSPRAVLEAKLQENPNGAPFARRPTSAVDRVRAANGE